MFVPSRLGAFVIDCLFACLPLLVIAPVALTFILSAQESSQFVGKFILLWSILPVTLFFLSVDTVQVARGKATLGRRLFKLEIVRSGDGQPSDWLNALRRLAGMIVFPLLVVLLKLPVLLLVIPALGALLDKRGRAPWDLVAGTELRQAPSSEDAAAQRLRSSDSD